MEGDMGWKNPQYRHWLCVIRQWCRFLCMEEYRVNKRVFNWAVSEADKKKTSYHHVIKFMCNINLNELCNIQNRVKFKNVKTNVIFNLSLYFGKPWLDKVYRVDAVNGIGLNKLQT